MAQKQETKQEARKEGARAEIEIPEGVTIELETDGLWYRIVVSGPLGTLERKFFPVHATISKEGNKVIVETKSKRKKHKALVGTIRGHIRNMIRGVTEGFEYKLKIVYEHFPMNVSVQGDEVVIKNYLGGKGELRAKILGDTKVEIKGEDVIVKGIDKELAGQTAANIEQAARPKGKDRRVFQDGIYIVEKPR